MQFECPICSNNDVIEDEHTIECPSCNKKFRKQDHFVSLLENKN